MGELKSKTLTLRITDAQHQQIKTVMKVLQDNRPPGSPEVPQTEAITIMLTMGFNQFNEKYNPEYLRKKQVKK